MASPSDQEQGGDKNHDADEDLDTGNVTVTPPKRKKRYCVFNKDWLKEFAPWLAKVDDATGNCIYCRQNFSVKYEGRKAIAVHANSAKHQSAVLTQKQSQMLSKFFPVKGSSEQDAVTAAELACTYQCVKHHHSYFSQDCGNKLLPKLLSDSAIAVKISCGRTKAASYVENVLGPKAQELCVTELKSAGYFGIGSDASNNGNKKLFPLTVRYFSRSDGLKDGLLDFYLDNDETSGAIADRIKDIIQQNDLDLALVSAYSADNASVNYGKHVSVYQKLALSQRHLIQANCKCHILNNCVKYGLKAVSFDVESFVIKVYNSFSSSAKDFFEFLQMEYVELLRHVTTR